MCKHRTMYNLASNTMHCESQQTSAEETLQLYPSQEVSNDRFAMQRDPTNRPQTHPRPLLLAPAAQKTVVLSNHMYAWQHPTAVFTPTLPLNFRSETKPGGCSSQLHPFCTGATTTCSTPHAALPRPACRFACSRSLQQTLPGLPASTCAARLTNRPLFLLRMHQTLPRPFTQTPLVVEWGGDTPADIRTLITTGDARRWALLVVPASTTSHSNYLPLEDHAPPAHSRLVAEAARDLAIQQGSGALSNHDSGSARLAPRQLGEERGVDDTQAAGTKHLEVVGAHH